MKIVLYHICLILLLLYSCASPKVYTPLCQENFSKGNRFLVYSENIYTDSSLNSTYFIITDTHLMKTNCKELKYQFQSDGPIEYYLDLIVDNAPVDFFVVTDRSNFNLGSFQSQLIPVEQKRWVISDYSKARKMVDSISKVNNYYLSNPHPIRSTKYTYELILPFDNISYFNEIQEKELAKYSRGFVYHATEELYKIYPEIPEGKLEVRANGNHYLATFPCDSTMYLDLTKLLGNKIISSIENKGKKIVPVIICSYHKK